MILKKVINRSVRQISTIPAISKEQTASLAKTVLTSSLSASSSTSVFILLMIIYASSTADSVFSSAFSSGVGVV